MFTDAFDFLSEEYRKISVKQQAETDPLGIEPDWQDLIKRLRNGNNPETSAKLIIYGINTSRPLPPGSILGKITSQEKREVTLPLEKPVSPEKLLKKISSEFDSETAGKIKDTLGERFSEKEKIKSLNFDREVTRKMESGTVPGISGNWRLEASGGTWSIYTNREKTKVLKAPNTVENGWESALLVLTHETVAETIEEKYRGSGLKAPGNHGTVIVEVKNSKMAVAVMDYEKNYVSNKDMKGLDKVQEALKKMYNSGELPTHVFDYDDQGIGRRNLAYRDGEFIALDLCDKSVLEDREYLEKHSIPEKARKMGFESGGNNSMLSGLFKRLF